MMAQETVTTAEVMARVLRDEGVEYIFGVGGGSILPLMKAAAGEGIKIVHVRHEQAAAFAADAYARCTRRPAVCFLFGGPGYTNASNGLAQAFYCKSPVIALVGQHATLVDHRGGSAVSYAADACRSFTKWSVRLVEERLAGFILKKAFSIATSYPPGPVVIEVPENLWVRRRAWGEQRSYLPGPLPVSEPGGGDPADIARTVELLARASRPAIVAGEQVYWEDAAAELRELVEELRLPVITRRLARGAVPEDHPLAFWGRVRHNVLRDADLVLLIGLSLGYLEDYGRWGRNLRFIQVQARPELVETAVPTEIVLIGNSKAILRQMVEHVREMGIRPGEERGSWLEVVAGLKQAEIRKLEEEAERFADHTPIHPGILAKEIVEFLEPDATVIFDAYTGSAFLTERLRARFPGHILDTGEWITVGHGVGMGIGAQLARPRKQVLVMMGDGGIGIGGFDIETAVRCRLPVVYVINNNHSWLSGEFDLFFGEDFPLPDGTRGNPCLFSPAIRYDRVFEPFGCHVERVEHPSEIKAALYRSFASGKTAVIDVEVDRKVYHPMLLRSGPAHRWLGPEGMPPEGRRLAFPELEG